MKGKKILIINGHPDKQSFNASLAESYYRGAVNTNATVDLLHIRDLDFNPNLQFGYRQRTELEPDLLRAIEMIKQADHLVWFFPMWWYGYPALMKGFIDRTFLPGITFAYQPGKAMPEKLLKGKTGRIIVTADTPAWYNKWIMGNPAINQFKKGTLEFCGVKPVKVDYIAPVKDASEAFLGRWLAKVENYGLQLK